MQGFISSEPKIFFFLFPRNSFIFVKLSNASSLVDASTEETKSSSSVVYEENRLISKDTRETCPPATFQIGEAEVNQDWIVAGPGGIRPEINISKSDPNLSSQSSLRAGDGRTADAIQLFQDGPYNGR